MVIFSDFTQAKWWFDFLGVGIKFDINLWSILSDFALCALFGLVSFSLS